MESTKRFSRPRKISCTVVLGTYLVSVGLLLFITLATDSGAQVTTNITSSGLGTTVSPKSSTGVVTITGGTRAGGNGPNLFHSFDQFSVGASNTANFLNETKTPTTNILSRVTGGNPSNIFGTLRTTDFGNANLFLINPSGIVFGSTATLDIGAATVGPRGAGSFHASTADYLRLQKGTDGVEGIFSANPSKATVLTAANPVAFGFLGPTPAGISIQTPLLLVPTGQTLSLVGGPIQISGSLLSASTGRIQIASVASAQEVTFSTSGAPALNVDPSMKLGEINLSNKSLLFVSSSSTSSTGGGTVLIRGGKLVMNDSSIMADTAGSAPGAPVGIDINIAGDIVIANPTTGATGGRGFIQSSNGSTGTGTGRAGNVFVSAGGNLQLTDGSDITAFTTKGQAGNVTVNVGTLTLTGGSRIDSSDFGSGTAGTVTITATDSLTVSGSNIKGPSTIATQALNGVAGQVFITTPTLKLADTGQILASTSGAGHAGDIQIRASQVTLDNSAVVTAVTSGSGRAGSVSLEVDNLTLTNGAGIEASTTGAGKAGDIRINATNDVTISGLSLDGQNRSGLRAKTQTAGLSGGGGGSGGSGGGSGGGGGGAAGAGGDIVVNAKNLTLNGGAQIDSSTVSGGAGGLVSITATDTITIAGTSTRLDSDSTRGNGNGGSVRLQAKDIVVRDGAFVSANSAGTADAGAIDLTAQNTLTLENGGTISTSTAGSGRGGTITVRADQVLMDGTGSSITASTLPPFADLTVTLSIQHPNDSDLTVQLDSPDGSRVALFSRVGGSGANFINTKLDDSASKPITSGTAPFTGTFIPREPLAQLFGEHATGVWTLNIRDTVPGNVGSLQNWSLQLGTQMFNSSEVPKSILDNGSIQSSLVVNAGSLLVKGTGDSKGNGGDITINVRSLSLQNGATVSATSTGLGRGGTVQVNASEGVTISGANTGLSTNAESKGVGGDITLKGGQLDLTNGALISANSTGTGNAGNISITAADRFVMRDSTVTTQAAVADGGNIDIHAVNLVQLVNSSITTSVGTGAGNGGNITIDPHLVVLDKSKILAEAFGGDGGNIHITADIFLVSPDSLIDASSALGVSGTITIQSPLSDLSGSLAPLPQGYLQAGALLRSRCAARAGSSTSSLVVAGRDGVPTEPGGLLPSPMSETGETGTAETSPREGFLMALNLAGETLDGGCTQ